MIANSNVLNDEAKGLLKSKLISYKVLEHSKNNTLAFLSGPKRREFEIEFKNNGGYRIQTRFLGYKKVMDESGFTVEKRRDPDGNRYLFQITVNSVNELNETLVDMLNIGFNNQPEVERVEEGMSTLNKVKSTNNINSGSVKVIAGINNREYRDRLLKLIKEVTNENVGDSDYKLTRYEEETLFECLEMWNPNINDRTNQNSMHYCKDAVCIVFPKKTLIDAIRLKDSEFKIEIDKNGNNWICLKSTESLRSFIKLLSVRGYSFKGKNNFTSIRINNENNKNTNISNIDNGKDNLFRILIEQFTPNNRTVYKGDSISRFKHTRSNDFIVDYVDDPNKKECKVKIDDGKKVLFEAFVNNKNVYPYRICTEKKFYEKIKLDIDVKPEFHPSWDKQLEIKELNEENFKIVCKAFVKALSKNTITVSQNGNRKEKSIPEEQKEVKRIRNTDFEESDADNELNTLMGIIDTTNKYVEGYKPVIEKDERKTNAYKRNPIVANNALFKARGLCALDSSHKSFIKPDGSNYLEVHHLIPMKEQSNFNEPLDREENVVCLCPNCHRKIHYGKDKYEMIEKLYKQREKEINDCGINTSLDFLYSYYK